MRKFLLLLSVMLALSLVAVMSVMAHHAGDSSGVLTLAAMPHQGGREPTLALSASADQPITTPLLSEGFEGSFFSLGWYHSEFPLTKPDEPSQPWELTTDRAYSGTQSVFHDDYPGWQDAWLVTPVVTPTVTSELVFWQSERYTVEHQSHSVWISLGSGNPRDGQFLKLAELDPAPGLGWGDVQLALGEYTGKPVYLAFRYLGDYADQWYVDEVEVTSSPLYEGFEDGFFSQGWEHFEFPIGVGPETLSEAWSPTDARTHTGDYSAYHNDDPGMQDAWLVAPQIIPSVVSELTFWHSENYTYAHGTHSIWISVDSGDPKDGQFIRFTELELAPDPGWEEVRLDLGEYVGQPLYVAFRYQGDYAAEWYIDDVEVNTGLMLGHNGPKAPGEIVTLSAYSPQGTNVSYQWDLGDGTITTGLVISHTYMTAGDFTAVVTASNSVSILTQTLIVPIRFSSFLPLILR